MAHRAPKPISPSEAVHVVTGEWNPPGARDVVVLFDSLTLGPCHTDPDTHGALRQEFWLSFERDIAGLSGRKTRRPSRAHRNELAREILTTKQLIAALRGCPESLPIVLWTSSNPGDRVSFWWMLDALDRGGVALTRCWVADSQYPEHEPRTFRSYRAQPVEVIQDAFARSSPLTPARARQGASLWSKYASPSPAALERLRHSGSLGSVDRRVVSDLLRWALPRIVEGAKQRVRLCEFDQLLLGHLDEANWVRPYDVLVNVVKELHARETLDCYGDRVFSQRFAVWGRHQPDDPALVSQPVSSGVNSLTSIAYRLTPKGRRIVDVGLDDPQEAPEFHVGGCQVYRGSPLWARHIMGKTEWRMKKLNWI